MMNVNTDEITTAAHPEQTEPSLSETAWSGAYAAGDKFNQQRREVIACVLALFAEEGEGRGLRLREAATAVAALEDMARLREFLNRLAVCVDTLPGGRAFRPGPATALAKLVDELLPPAL